VGLGKSANAAAIGEDHRDGPKRPAVPVGRLWDVGPAGRVKSASAATIRWLREPSRRTKGSSRACWPVQRRVRWKSSRGRSSPGGSGGCALRSSQPQTFRCRCSGAAAPGGGPVPAVWLGGAGAGCAEARPCGPPFPTPPSVGTVWGERSAVSGDGSESSPSVASRAGRSGWTASAREADVAVAAPRAESRLHRRGSDAGSARAGAKCSAAFQPEEPPERRQRLPSTPSAFASAEQQPRGEPGEQKAPSLRVSPPWLVGLMGQRPSRAPAARTAHGDGRCSLRPGAPLRWWW
jgi:hypothetical protein